MNMNEKLFSGKFWLAIITGICLLSLTIVVGAVLWNNPTGDVSGAVSTVIGILAATISTVIANYFNKKDDR